MPSTDGVSTRRAAKAGLCIGCGRLVIVLACAAGIAAEPVRVQHPEGTLHGFLSLTTEAGQVLAQGDLINLVKGDRVTSRLTFHFKDGSLDDETTVFTQRDRFRLVSDHHIQRGPYFPQQLDMTIDVAKGIVETRTRGKDNKVETTTERMKLPEDLYNGVVTPVIKNLSPDTPETKISMIVATPRPRLVTLAIEPQVPLKFELAGFPHKALGYEVKIELGGLAGMIAPVIGKQPPNIYMWIEAGEVPVFLRETGPLFDGGAPLSISLIGPTLPQGSHE